MLKQKEYNLSDSNISNLGTDLEKKVRLESAKCEKEWEGAGKDVGLDIWRIENFGVKRIAKEDYGKFFSGDSYIVLNTYKKGNALRWDVHFWLGKYTTQDEAGTAAYKTVELDDRLNGTPVQHREVQDHESKLFLSYFTEKCPVRILEGGIESAFTHVKPTEYKERLLWIKGKLNNVRVREIEKKASMMNSGDVFILDQGLKVWQWNGSKSGAGEKAVAAKLTRALDDERGSKVEITVMEEGDQDTKAFFEHLEGDEKEVQAHDAVEHDSKVKSEKVLYKLSDASGKLTFTKVGEGKVKRDLLDTNDVFIFDVGNEVFAWVGKGASVDERKFSLHYAQDYLAKENRPEWLPVSRILEGGENEVFESSFD